MNSLKRHLDEDVPRSALLERAVPEPNAGMCTGCRAQERRFQALEKRIEQHVAQREQDAAQREQDAAQRDQDAAQREREFQAINQRIDELQDELRELRDAQRRAPPERILIAIGPDGRITSYQPV